MFNISLEHYLFLGAILFTIGVLGIFLNKKNLIVILMSIELILLSVNINFIAFSSYLNDIDPFHDSKGSIRIGNYLRLIQESLQKGLTKDDAIIYSNKKYSEIWGSDKVLRYLNNWFKKELQY